MTEPWPDKHKPRRLRDIVGQSKAVQDVTRWADSWKRGNPSKRVALFYGPAGTGKSAAAFALAQDFGWDFIEMNASDKRTLSEVKRIAGPASTAGTLFGGAAGKRLIVLDEADNIYGTYDRGGYRAIEELIHGTGNPVILIVNDKGEIPWQIKASCLMVGFGRLAQGEIESELERIAKSENVDVEPLAIRVIAETARGDLRSAINDLQTTSSGKKHVTIKDVILYRRDQETNVEEFITRLLDATTAQEARALLWQLDMPPNDAIAWIGENVPRVVVDPKSRAMVYDAIYRADIMLGRARRRQAFKLWGYASDLMSAGVSMSRGEQIKPSKVSFPSHIRRYGRTRIDRAIRDAVARKIAARCHTSSNVARRDFMPYLHFLFKHDKQAAAAIAGELELTAAEAGFLKKM